MDHNIKFAIEFRSGSYFRGDCLPEAYAIKEAYLFSSVEEAEDLMEEKQWMLFAGGMVVPVFNKEILSGVEKNNVEEE